MQPCPRQPLPHTCTPPTSIKEQRLIAGSDHQPIISDLTIVSCQASTWACALFTSRFQLLKVASLTMKHIFLLVCCQEIAKTTTTNPRASSSRYVREWPVKCSFRVMRCSMLTPGGKRFKSPSLVLDCTGVLWFPLLKLNSNLSQDASQTLFTDCALFLHSSGQPRASDLDRQ